MDSKKKKITGFLVLMALLLVTYVALKNFGYESYLDASALFEQVKIKQGEWKAYYHEYPVKVISLYIAIYVVSCAFSLPISMVLSLTGGAIFGWVQGVVVISFASTLGACAAFWLSRFFLHDWFQEKYKEKIVTINEGIEKDGAMYLLSMRLVPWFPFFVINFLMGLSSMRFRTYYWATQIGMLPSSMVLVYAGTELGTIERLEGVVSFKVLMVLTLLGVFPIFMKKLFGKLRKSI